jgi:putative transferase (TIGR04331 family)
MKNLIISDDETFYTKCSEKVVLENFLEYKFKNKFSTTKVNFVQNLSNDFKFVNSKYYNTLEKMCDYLNQLHDKNYSLEFWTKILGVGFYRLIYMTYNEFKKYEQIELNNKNLIFNILHEKSYYIPNDFNDMRNVIQYDSFGQEQLFSIYYNTFYDDKSIIKVKKKYSFNKNNNNRNSVYQFFSKLLSKKLLLKILNKLSNYQLIRRNIEVGIYQSYFSDTNFINLITGSLFKIGQLNIKQPTKIESKIFNRISFFDIKVEDKFDRYFINVMKSCIPKNIIENFDSYFSNYELELKKYPKLKYIINESFIGNHDASFLLAVSKELYGISHYYNEHNKLNHFYKYNINSIISKMTECYLTLGWSDKSNLKYIKLGSLYEYIYKGKKKNTLILYISTVGFSKVSEFANSSFDTSGNNVEKYISFRNNFLKNLPIDILEKITYKGYAYNSEWNSIWDIDLEFRYKIKQYQGNNKAKQLMLKSRLVIVDYQSTSHLESLLMNIPTIFFWIIGTYEINNEFTGEYDNLISCGICQTNSEEAANFISELEKNHSIEKWWHSDKTQSARKEFLDRNIGNPKDAINFYLSLAK